MIFGVIRAQDISQENEKVRLSASDSFITQDEDPITSVKIEPDTGVGFIEVSGTGISPQDWNLDWVYTSAGTKTVSLEITTTLLPAPVTATFTKTIEVVTAVSDALFASDEDLKKFEPDIMRWLPKGYSTWNFVHRKVQDKILTELYKSRVFKANQAKIEKADIVDKSEVREWAAYLALHIIFMGIQNAVDDVFAQKAQAYKKKADEFQQYTFNVLAFDFNGDGNLSSNEKYDLRSGSLIRR